MIYETADNVMRWLGFGVHPLGEAKGESGVHGGFKQGAHAAGAAAGARMSQVPQRGAGGRERSDHTQVQNGAADVVAGGSNAQDRGATGIGKGDGFK